VFGNVTRRTLELEPSTDERTAGERPDKHEEAEDHRCADKTASYVAKDDVGDTEAEKYEGKDPASEENYELEELNKRIRRLAHVPGV